MAEGRWAALASDGSLWVLDGDDGQPLARQAAPTGTVAIAAAGASRLRCIDEMGRSTLLDVVASMVPA